MTQSPTTPVPPELTRVDPAYANAVPIGRSSHRRKVGPRLAPADGTLEDLATMLDLLAARIAEHGTLPEVELLEVLAAIAEHASPGAAAALVDWDGSEVARLRAFGVVHGVVLEVLAPCPAPFLLGRFVGRETALAG